MTDNGYTLVQRYYFAPLPPVSTAEMERSERETRAQSIEHIATCTDAVCRRCAAIRIFGWDK